MAAVLAGGPRAALSHGSAATLWGVTKEWATPLEVTAPGHREHRRLRIHRSLTFDPLDVTEHFGVPVTTPARTLFDLAPRLPGPAIARAVSELRLARYLWLADLAELLDRVPPCRAGKLLRHHLAHPERAPTRSEFERTFLAFAQRQGLPEPAVNRRVAGHEVDILFPAHRLVVELDGYGTHGTREQFEVDRERDADLLAADIATLRVTWERLNLRPDREAARLREILARREPRPPSSQE
jgi:very-short-patch-repair endonuclease